METQDWLGVSLFIGAGFAGQADNDNWGVCSEWQTPAEALQKIRRMKAEMRRELAADFSLRSCPKHRMIWESLHAAEKCALWHYFGVRN